MERKKQIYIESILRDKLKWEIKKGPIKITQLTEGGSERNFYRVSADKHTLVYMSYTGEKEENKYYSDIARLLEDIKIDIAKIYFEEEGNIFLEDLGNVHLYNLALSHPEKDIVKYYDKVLEQLVILHSRGAVAFKNRPFKISKEFDGSLYKWESKYFMDNLIGRYYGLEIDKNLSAQVDADFNYLAESLSKCEKYFVHRDCQSKNIIVKDNKPYFIDFQGMRYGLPQYDLASLVEDPYVYLSEDVKDELKKYYFDKYYDIAGKKILNYDDFLTVYRQCAIQRLMQALGAYGFLGLVKEKKEFLKYIPNALCRIRSILDQSSGLNGLKRLLDVIPEAV